MNSKAEILLEGSYLYFQNNSNFSQENFKFLQSYDRPTYYIQAEILSRIETGEFLKVAVHYEMTMQFTPIQVRIEKSIGDKYALETYKCDIHNQELHYSFESDNERQEHKKQHSAKHYITTPAVSTAGIFTLSRKFDATGKTPILFVNSSNDWSYEGPPTDKMLFGEFKNRDMTDFKINNNFLTASHLCLYEQDSFYAGTENKPVNIYLSKHYGIPYQLEHEDLRVSIKHLKKNT